MITLQIKSCREVYIDGEEPDECPFLREGDMWKKCTLLAIIGDRFAGHMRADDGEKTVPARCHLAKAGNIIELQASPELPFSCAITQID